MAALLGAAFGLSACGSNVKGDYCHSEMGINTVYRFDGRGSVELTSDAMFGGTQAIPYRVDGDKIYLGGDQGQAVMKVTENGDLDAGLMTLSPC